jgi:cytochrome c553
MKRIGIALMCMLTAGWLGAAQAEQGHSANSGGSSVSAEEIVNQGIPSEGVAPCKSCHGETGKSPVPMYPHLAGQYKDYMAQVLKDYRSGERTNATMNQQAGALTDSQIEALAAYFANQKSAVATLPK